MKFGINMFTADFAIQPAELGRAIEERGFESLFVPEHTHIPTSRKSPWPGGAELPPEYFHAHDPFIALGMVAAVTTSLKIGTGVCLVIERDTITLAKEVATLDYLSGGRFLFGIGGGWNYEEMENHGTNPKTRWRKLREQILAMKEIWSTEEPEFHGEFVNFDPIWQYPKPAQQPNPPVLIGGAGPRTFDRVIEYGDGWLPIAGRMPPEVLREKMQELQQKAESAGRGRIPVSLFSARPDPALIEEYASQQVERCIFNVPAAGRDVVLPRLDELANLVAKAGVK